ncbi:MAG: aldehyde ferredoxin oxidoreductase N-terminal domain-containing protein [Desulfobacca sp.]|uniref:aldehyde ferredoxin oxidoreductase N-terminal domain-containing protein n=1 Tax=Desulfobacca sp. TaxID=2067990 RepID=UPI00404A4FD9
MIRDHFRVLLVDLATGRGQVETLEGRDLLVGGSGLAALLFQKYGNLTAPWDDPQQPLIFAIGPLTGYFPLMSKTVLGFKSPYHNQYAESHAGGRSALALRFADYDALVLTGQAPRPSVLDIGSRHLQVYESAYLWGMDVLTVGKFLRRKTPGAGHRSIIRIGPAGENRAAIAGINVDTYRHFGRLGGGAALGAKNLKAIIIQGDGSFPLPAGVDYAKLFADVHKQLTQTQMMQKYHNLGTPANVAVLNNKQALPIRNLQQTSAPEIAGISGEQFAEHTLLRNVACAGCPVGCIHLGYVRRRFHADHRYYFRQVAYDHEPIFAVGAMLGVYHCADVLQLIDMTEKMGLDVISAGVALAWATEATANGLISERETIVPLAFGDTQSYEEALRHLALGSTDFYRLLAQGTATAAAHYGGQDYACILGQEMAGYATGEVFVVSQALGFRHSHLDTAGYAFDQSQVEREVEAALKFLLQEERSRVLLTSLVVCLFAREVYKDSLVAECLHSLGYDTLAGQMEAAAHQIQQLRWQLRLATGFDPQQIRIPKRFLEVRTWKGPLDPTFLAALQQRYAQAIVSLAGIRA